MSGTDASETSAVRRRFGGLADRLRDRHQNPVDRFGAVLLLSVITISGLTLFDLYGEGIHDGAVVAATLLSMTVGLTMILALRAAGVSRRARRAATMFILFTSTFSLVAMIITLATNRDLATVGVRRPSAIWVVIALMIPIYIVRRLVRHKRVTIQTMFGAVSAYLMIAVGYSYLFLFVADMDPDPFFAGSDDQTSTSFAYFSLTTITTLGYGDLAPATSLGRLLATSEAIVGQVYLVTFVAFFVGIFINQRGESDTVTPPTARPGTPPGP